MRDRMWEIKQEGMLTKWAELIAEQEESGRSIASWCEEQGISISTYKHWHSKVQAAGAQSDTVKENSSRVVCEEVRSEFVRISLKQDEREDSSSEPMMRISIGEATCEIYAGADPCVVGRAVSALAVSL